MREAMTMSSEADRPRVDTQSLTDVDTYLYEAIATLEYTGRPVTRDEIARVGDLDGPSLDDALADLVRRGLLVADESGGETGYAPAQRGWSAAPDQARGM
jgi:hypothetical protein